MIDLCVEWVLSYVVVCLWEWERASERERERNNARKNVFLTALLKFALQGAYESLLCQVTRMNGSWHTYECVMAHIWMGHVTRMNESHTYGWVMSHMNKSHMWQVTPAQEWTNRTLISHEQTSVHFLVLPGRLLSFTDITEYTYISLL